MGCDIHCYAEVKKNGKWVKVGNKFKNPYYREIRGQSRYIDSPCIERNYDLFAILANVRNEDGFKAISKPKGIPKDVSKRIKEMVEEWGDEAHSHSWHTLKDLLKWNWDQVVTRRGIVDIEEYKNFKKRGYPRSWGRDVWGSNLYIISSEEMDKLIKSGEKKSTKRYYVKIKWKESYRDAVGKWFFKETLPALQKLGEPENVRIVFWFDS